MYLATKNNFALGINLSFGELFIESVYEPEKYFVFYSLWFLCVTPAVLLGHVICVPKFVVFDFLWAYLGLASSRVAVLVGGCLSQSLGAL